MSFLSLRSPRFNNVLDIPTVGGASNVLSASAGNITLVRQDALMGVNLGNDQLDGAPYNSVQNGSDLNYLARYTTKIRIALPSYTDAQGILNMRQLALDAKSAGFTVSYGVTGQVGSSTTLAQYNTWLSTAIYTEAAWAFAHGIPNFHIGNEEDWAANQGKITGKTAASVETDVLAAASTLKGLYPSGMAIWYTTAQGTVADWSSAGTTNLDALGINCYDTLANFEANMTYFQSLFGSKFFLSEWSTNGAYPADTDGSDAAMAYELTQRLDSYEALSLYGYLFTWRMGGSPDWGVIAGTTFEPGIEAVGFQEPYTFNQPVNASAGLITLEAAIPTTAGQSALRFDGVQNNVDFGVVSAFASVTATQPFTIEMWINWYGSTIDTCLFNLGLNYGANLGYEVKLTQPGLLQLYYGNSAVSQTGATVVVPGTATHVALTFDGTNLYMHVGGVNVYNAAFTGIVGDPVGGDVMLGAEGPSFNVFSGTIDEIRYSSISRYTSAGFTPQTWDFNTDSHTIALYHLDDRGTTVYDSSGNGHNSTSFNGTPAPLWVDGLIAPFAPTVAGLITLEEPVPTTASNALTFSGSNYVDISTTSPVLNTANISFGGWFTISSSQTNTYPHMMALGGSDNGCIYYYVTSGDVRVKFGGLIDTHISYPTFGVLHHYAVAFDSVNTYMYVDGVLVNTFTSVGAAPFTSNSVYIANNDGGGVNLEGSVSSVFVYNRTLNATDVANIYNRNYPTGSQVLLWNFTQSSGSSALDSFNSNTGTLISSPTWSYINPPTSAGNITLEAINILKTAAGIVTLETANILSTSAGNSTLEIANILKTSAGSVTVEPTALSTSAGNSTLESTSRNTSAANATLEVANTLSTSAGNVTLEATGIVRTNMIPNPSFENDTTFWGLDSDYTRTTDSALFGTYGIKQISSGGYANFTTVNDGSGYNVIPGATYTFSFWANITLSSGSAPTFEIMDSANMYGGSSLVNTGLFPHSGVWSQYFYTFVATGPKISMRIFNNNGSVTAFYDGFMLEQASGVGTYFDGSTPGGKWFGTTNDSLSELLILGSSAGSITLESTTLATSAGNVTLESTTLATSAGNVTLEASVPNSGVVIYADEPMVDNAPVNGTITSSGGPAGVWNSAGYLVLTTASNSESAEIDFTAALPTNFDAYFDFWTSGPAGSGADAVWFYFGATAAVSGEDGANFGYSFAFDEYGGDNEPYQIHHDTGDISFGITSGAATFNDSNWHTAHITVRGHVLTMFQDGVQVLTVTDGSFSTGGNHFGLGSRTGGLNNEHRVRNFLVYSPSFPTSAGNVTLAVSDTVNTSAANVTLEESNVLATTAGLVTFEIANNVNTTAGNSTLEATTLSTSAGSVTFELGSQIAGNTTLEATGVIRSNFFTNPSMETNNFFWNISGTYTNIGDTGANPGGNVVQDTTHVLFGTYAARMYKISGVQQYLNGYTFVPTPNVNYTFSAWVWISASYPSVTQIGIGIRSITTYSNFAGTTVRSITPGVWTQLSYTANGSAIIAGTGETGAWRFIIADPNVDAVWWVDGALLETSSSVGTYFDGSMPGAFWTGTANQSTSELLILGTNAGNATLESTTLGTSAGLVPLEITNITNTIAGNATLEETNITNTIAGLVTLESPNILSTSAGNSTLESTILATSAGNTTLESANNTNTSAGNSTLESTTLATSAGLVTFELVSLATSAGNVTFEIANTLSTTAGNSTIESTTLNTSAGNATLEITALSTSAGNTTLQNSSVTNASPGLVTLEETNVVNTNAGLITFEIANNLSTLAGLVTLEATGVIRTNYIVNPSVEINLAGYSTYSSNGAGHVTITQDTTNVLYGTYAIKMVADGSVVGQQVQSGNFLGFNVGNTLSYSVAIYSIAGGENLALQFNELNSGGGYLGSFQSTWFTTVVGWQTKTFHHTLTDVGAAGATALISSNVATPITIWSDGWMVEEATSNGSYFDGSTPGGFWTSGTNSSISELLILGTNAGLVSLESTTLATSAGSVTLELTNVTNTIAGNSTLEETVPQNPMAGLATLELANNLATNAGSITLEESNVLSTSAGLITLEATSILSTSAGNSTLDSTSRATSAGLVNLELITVNTIAGLTSLELVNTNVTAGLVALQATTTNVVAGLVTLELTNNVNTTAGTVNLNHDVLATSAGTIRLEIGNNLNTTAGTVELTFTALVAVAGLVLLGYRVSDIVIVANQSGQGLVPNQTGDTFTAKTSLDTIKVTSTQTVIVAARTTGGITATIFNGSS